MDHERSSDLAKHLVVSHEHWIAARTAFLAKEKEFTRLRDELNQQRRELPWEEVTKNYVFDGSDGEQTLAALFESRSQLVVYHFMFGPDWDAGCRHCSFWADTFNPIIVHLNQRDVSMVAISRAPVVKIEEYRKRMGWTFKWLSSLGNDFNFDFQASFRPEDLNKGVAFYNFNEQKEKSSEREGASVFYKDPIGNIFHTYSTYARGIDLMNTAYNYLDLVPKGVTKAIARNFGCGDTTSMRNLWELTGFSSPSTKTGQRNNAFVVRSWAIRRKFS